ncbi:YdgA family protein [Brenneria izbisi]|uniref:YdgA family protein n=1 Tax=Brenneria izbisi TaxID=2939450 RepID=A0AA41XTM6_9GAMM|nr:YdgA family protein [Brenneria izbisi]MCV9877405.1 YdgA family protein [Brenneria izbisi]MCV9881029.1 YdgA family protein [Brenneria izbisi]
MKKSLVAAGVIIALGAVWTGASWYTGKQLAQQIDGFTDTLNTQLKKNYPDAGIKIVYRDYQGGIFSSKLSYVLQSDGTAKEAPLLAPGQEVVLNETVSHGPFPLAEIKRFNLLPSMASVHSELANTDAVKALFALTKDKPFFSAQTRVTYGGDTQSVVTLLPLEFQNDVQKFAFSGTTAQVDVGRDLRDSRLEGTISNLMSEKKNPWGETEKLVVNDFTLKGNNHKGKFELNLGDADLSIKSVTFSVENGDPVTLNNISVQTQLTEDETDLAGKMALALESMTIAERNLGSGAMHIVFSRFDGKGAKAFATAYQQNVEQMLYKPEIITPEAYQHELTMTFLQYLPQLLKSNPNVTISPISWKNSKGEGTFTLALDMTDPLQNSAKATDPNATDEEKIILQSVKKLDVKLNVPLAMLTELMVQAGPQGKTDEEKKQAVAMAQQQAQMMAGIGQMNQISVTRDNAITSSLQYADGQVDFNGNKMTLGEFIAPFISLPSEDKDEAQPDTDSQQEPVAP